MLQQDCTARAMLARLTMSCICFNHLASASAEHPRDTLNADTAEAPSQATAIAEHSNKKQHVNLTQGMPPVEEP